MSMTSSFLKDIVKEIDNDYAGLLSEGGVGDIESFVDTGSYILMLSVAVQSMEVYPLIKLLHLQERVVQVKHFSVWV